MEWNRLAKKLEEYGLRKFITKYGFEMNHSTLIPEKMAAHLGMDMDEIEKLMAQTSPYDKNFFLYKYISVLTPKAFLDALVASSNLQVLKIVRNHIKNFHAQEDEPIIQLIRDELEFLCGNTKNLRRFEVALVSKAVIEENRDLPHSAVQPITLINKCETLLGNQQEDLKILYEAVIEERAWDELLFALKVSENQLVTTHLVDKGFLLNAAPANPSPLPMKRRREMEVCQSSGSKELDSVNSFGLIQNDWKCSFTYTSISSQKKSTLGLPDFIPSKDTTSVRISRLNFETTDLTQILRNCKDQLENLTIDDVSFGNFDSPLPSSKPAQIQILPLPKLKSYSIQFAQNRPHIMTDINYHKQALFFTPSSEQLCHLWHSGNTIETIDFIFERSRLFKMSPKIGELILRDYRHFDPVKFFQMMNQPASKKTEYHLKSFSGKGLKKLEASDIPITVQRLHLRDCDKIESTLNFHNFSHLKKLIISISIEYSNWELDLKELAQLKCLESIAAEKVTVKNAELIETDSINFSSLTHVLFHACLYEGLRRDSEIAKIKNEKPKDSIIMEKRGGWLVFGSSSYQGNFQEHLKTAFQNSDFETP